MIRFLRSFGFLAFLFIMLPYTVASYGTNFWQGDAKAWSSLGLLLEGLIVVVIGVSCAWKIVVRQTASPYLGWALWTVLCTAPGLAITGFAPFFK